jgi:hypothetical protein
MKMLAHYFHVELEAGRQTLDVLSRQVEGAVALQFTPQKEAANPQVHNLVVDVTGFEPATPCLQSRCSPS